MDDGAYKRWLAKLEKHAELLHWSDREKLLQFELHLTGKVDSGVARTSPMLGHSMGTLRLFEILRKVQKHLGGLGHAFSA